MGDLLGGGAQLTEVSLLAARAAVIVDRLSRGESVISDDESILLGMADLMADAAAVVEFFQSGGRQRPARAGALTDVRVAAAIDALCATESLSAASFRRLGDRFRAVGSPWSIGEIDTAVAYSNVLAGIALRPRLCRL